MLGKTKTIDEVRFLLNEVYNLDKGSAHPSFFQNGGAGETPTLKSAAETVKRFEQAYREKAPVIAKNENKNPSSQTRLIELRAKLDGYRALYFDTALQLATANGKGEDVVKGFASEYVTLMAPILNGYAVNPHSREKGNFALAFMAAAMDPKDLGFKLGLFMNPLAEEIKAAKTDSALAPHAEKLEEGMKVFQGAALDIVQQGMSGDTRTPQYQAGDFARIFSSLAVGRAWLQMMAAAKQRLDEGATGNQAEFYNTKLTLGEYYLNKVMMPDIKRAEMRMEAGTATFSKITSEQLAPKPDSGIAMKPGSNDNKRKPPRLSF